MTLRDALEKALEIVNDGSIDLETESEKQKTLIGSAKMICHELSSVYASPVTEEEIEFSLFKADYSIFSERVKDIISVKSGSRRLAFSPQNRYVAIAENGSFSVKYSYIPAEPTLDGELDLPPAITDGHLAWGIAAEYLFRMGFIEEANVYKNRYDLVLVNQLREKRRITLKAEKMI